jgi:hypothetical protein
MAQGERTHAMLDVAGEVIAKRAETHCNRGMSPNVVSTGHDMFVSRTCRHR